MKRCFFRFLARILKIWTRYCRKKLPWLVLQQKHIIRLLPKLTKISEMAQKVRGHKTHWPRQAPVPARALPIRTIRHCLPSYVFRFIFQFASGFGCLVRVGTTAICQIQPRAPVVCLRDCVKPDMRLSASHAPCALSKCNPRENDKKDSKVNLHTWLEYFAPLWKKPQRRNQSYWTADKSISNSRVFSSKYQNPFQNYLPCLFNI